VTNGLLYGPERDDLSQPNTSLHFACLPACGLVTWEREGKFVYYAIADKRAVKLLDQAEALLLQVAPLIAACPRYRQPARARTAAPAKRRGR
jgi:DNA-binding transcriptional ArsR family regulator